MLVQAIIFFLVLFNTVPYKADNEFSVKFSLMFKKRAEVPHKDWVASDANAPKVDSPDNNSPLPFMQATLEVLTKNPDEIKVRIVRGAGKQMLKKKIKEGMKEAIFAEFVDDIKSQISEYTHTIYFLNEDGEPVSQIVIEFDEEGFYLVNGKKKGKL